jgi:putative MATE family efflux protein
MPTDRAVCPFEKDPMSSQAPGQMIAEPVEGGPPALPPVPSILMLAWPTIAGNLLYSVVGLVNTKIVGSLGASAVAAVTTGHRMFFVLQALLMAITVGTTALVARAWGAGDRDEAERVTKASMLVCVLVALVMAVPGLLFAEQLAGIFRLDEETIAEAASFIRWLSVFNVAFAVPFVLGTAVRAAGDTMTPLWIGVITNLINVVLVYALVYGGLGLPSLGVTGAAIATGLAFTAGAVIFLAMWWRGSLRVGLGPGGSLQRRRLMQLVRIGSPAGLEQLVWQGGFIAFLWIVALYGTAPYAAYGIGVNILSLSFVVGFGFSIAAATHVGQRLGAHDPEGAVRSGWHATRLAVVAMVGLGAAVVLGAPFIAGLMIDDAEVVRLTVIFIYILGVVQPLMAIEFTLGGALRGAGDTRFPLLTTIVGLVIVRGCVAALFLWLDYPVEWIFAALIFDYIVKATMLVARFRRGGWKTIEI